MKKKLSLLLCLCLIICSFSFSVNADDEINESTVSYVENEVIVTTNVYYDVADFTGASSYQFNGISITAIEPLFDADTVDDVNLWVSIIGNRFYYKITLTSSWNASNAIPILESSNNIVLASYNCIISESSANSDIPPSDSYGYLESVEEPSSTGTDYQQNLHEYLNIESVWSKSFVGSDDVIVAVIDTGFSSHVDLQDNVVWDLAYNATDGTSNVVGTSRHGNMVSGIIGADYDDGGINGICQEVKIIPIKVSLSNYASDLLNAVNYAIANGADIINVSITMNHSTEAVVDATEQAGVLLITSAGNEDCDIGTSGTYAKGKRHDSPYWIVVGASTLEDAKSDPSCYSSSYVDIFAPTTDIVSTDLTSYGTSSGGYTSFAAPQVAAACALIMSKATHLTPLEVKALLMDNVKEVESLENLCVSGGVLSISNAVGALFAEPRAAYEKGDVNGDGQITAADYLMCKQVVFGNIDYTDEQFDAADVNFDGTVTASDYFMLQKFIYGTYYFPPR